MSSLPPPPPHAPCRPCDAEARRGAFPPLFLAQLAHSPCLSFSIYEKRILPDDGLTPEDCHAAYWYRSFLFGANPALSSLPCRPFDATAALQNRMRLRCCRLLREDGEILDAYFLSNFYCLLYYLLNFSISGAISVNLRVPSAVLLR